MKKNENENEMKKKKVPAAKGVVLEYCSRKTRSDVAEVY